MLEEQCLFPDLAFAGEILVAGTVRIDDVARVRPVEHGLVGGQALSESHERLDSRLEELARSQRRARLERAAPGRLPAGPRNFSAPSFNAVFCSARLPPLKTRALVA